MVMIDSYDKLLIHSVSEFESRLLDYLAIQNGKKVKLHYDNPEQQLDAFNNILRPSFDDSILQKPDLKNNFLERNLDFNWYIDIFICIHSTVEKSKESVAFRIEPKVVKSMLLECKSLKNYIYHEIDRVAFYYERLVDNLLFIFEKMQNKDGSKFKWKDETFKRGLKMKQTTLKIVGLSLKNSLFGNKYLIMWPDLDVNKNTVEEFVDSYLNKENEELLRVEKFSVGEMDEVLYDSESDNGDDKSSNPKTIQFEKSDFGSFSELE